MENRTITAEDLKKYFSYSETISDFESTLYESGDQLNQEEFKINSVIDEQNRTRFDENENDLFRDQLETVIKILADNYKDMGFEYDLYFDLVYNLLLLEYDRMNMLANEDGVGHMLDEIGISGHIDDKVKALLDHEKEGGGCGKC
jgi:hypothetical protein